MKRLIRYQAILLIVLGLFSKSAYGDGVAYDVRAFSVTILSGTGTQIFYPPFKASLAEAYTYGELSYHYPDTDIDLTIDMLNLDRVEFSIYGQIEGSFVSGRTHSEDPFTYTYHMTPYWIQPHPEHAFELGSNIMVFEGTGPGEFPFIRLFELHFELNEITDMSGSALATISGFDIVSNVMVNSKRSNFIFKEIYGEGGHYTWPGHYWDQAFNKPADAHVVLPPPVWSGRVEMRYHFSLNYDAIDHAVLFDQFKDPDFGWDVGESGLTEQVEYQDDFAAKMTTGSTASMSRLIDTPDMPVLLMFNYAFLTEAGTLVVSLDDNPILTLSADDNDMEQGMMSHKRILIADREVLGRTENRLDFTLEGPGGSQAILDNIGVYAIKEYDGPTPGDGKKSDSGGGCFVGTVMD